METRKDSKDAPNRREMGKKGHCAQCGSPLGRYGSKFCGYECSNKGKARPTRKGDTFVPCTICLRRAGVSNREMVKLFPMVSYAWIHLAWKKAGFDPKPFAIYGHRERKRANLMKTLSGKPPKPAKEPKPKADRFKPRLNLIGQKYGQFTVIEYAGVQKWKSFTRHVWRCLCSCGNEWTGATALLRNGKTKSCGCSSKAAARKRWQSDDAEKKEHRRIANKLRDHMGGTIERIKAKGGSKDRKTVELLGCSIAMLIEHLEAQFAPGMTWANHGSMWEIDHIMPLARFNLTDAGHVRMAARYTNLQPLWKEQNAAKGDKIIPHQAILL